MSTFNNGGGTLKSTNKVAAALEIAVLLAKAEKLASTPQIPLNNIVLTFAQDTLGATITANIPVLFGINGGQMTVEGRDYLGVAYPGYVAFDPGTGGDVTSATLPGAFLEIANIMSFSEAAIPTNIVQTTPNTTTVSIDREAGVANITMSLPVDFQESALGELLVTAIDFMP